MTPNERFDAKVSRDDAGCWVWTASRQAHGYGRFGVSAGNVVLAHRFAFQRWVGPLVKGLVIDHTCRNRACVNPAHLRQVTQRENIFAPGSMSLSKVHAEKSHCPSGHQYTDENTERSEGQRWCRTCRRERSLARAA